MAGLSHSQQEHSSHTATSSVKANVQNHPPIAGGKSLNGKRMDSPDNDSAFCDNLSVLSSSYSNDAISANGSSSIQSNSKVTTVI